LTSFRLALLLFNFFFSLCFSSIRRRCCCCSYPSRRCVIRNFRGDGGASLKTK
jgi:hypothetical protein